MFENSSAKKILLLILVISVVGSHSLKLRKFLVPEVVKAGDNVTLTCEFDMEKDPLYNVKWHYEFFEFYRYVPHSNPEKMYFPLKYFKVDVLNSGPNKVVLLDVKPEQSGSYSCEVTSDAPSFYTIMNSGNMTISRSHSLKLKKFLVPEVVKAGDNVTLTCEYDMEKDPLYSVKWHFGSFEFYRYVPHSKPEKKYFPLPNFKVDILNSSPNKVVLFDVKPEQSGSYSCEVTSDAPTFATKINSANMTVSKSPALEVVEMSFPETVKSGQDVTLSCKYNLGQATLYHVRWYWKGQEFYRYEPKMVPNKVHFILPHFKVDIAHSGPTEVTLKNISSEQSGSYKCEVTTEGPLFKKYKKNATMNVITN